MSDGWETRRSQNGRGKYAKGGPLYGVERSEWAIIKFGAGGRGVVRFVEVDTAFHPGNYPVVCLSFYKSETELMSRRAKLRLRLLRVICQTSRPSGLLSLKRNLLVRIDSITLMSSGRFPWTRSFRISDTLSTRVRCSHPHESLD
jgi:hypothetical protein